MKKWSIYIVAAFVWAGCSDEIPDNPVRPVTPPAKDGEVALTIKFPNSGGPSTYADADIDGPKENKIIRLDILSFTKGTTASLLTDSFKYHIPISIDTITGGIDLDVSGITKKVQVKLQNMVEEQRLVIIANLPTPVDFASTYKEKTMQDIVNGLTFSGATWLNPTQAHRDTTSFPMFGQMTKFVEIHSTKPAPSEADMTFQMIRAVAKIDVYVDKYGTGDPALGFGSVFKIEKVHVYNASSLGYIAPYADHISVLNKQDTVIEKVNLVASDPRVEKFNYPFPSSGNRLGNLIYIPESGILNGSYEPAYLVIEATYYGEKFYYRIDFTHAGEYKPILRNHNYDINITGVRTKGYTSLEAAAAAPISRFGALELSLEDDIGLKEVISYNNEYYLAVNSTNLYLSPENQRVKIYLKSSFTGGAWEAAGLSGPGFEGFYPTGRDHNNPGAGKLDSIEFYIKLNVSGAPVSYTLNIKSGMLTQKITITQSPGSNSYIIKPNGGSASQVLIPLKSANVDGVPRISSDAITIDKLWGSSTTLLSQLSISQPAAGAVYVYSGGSETGNAVLAAKDASGKILYSWHIWVPDYDPEDPKTQKSNNGFIFMDRNLGAMKNGVEPASYGLYYQWGRKDPFYVEGGVANNNVVYHFGVNTIKPYVNYSDSAMQHPNTFYAVESIPYDWIGPNASQENTLWSTLEEKKGPYDPCPFGWRVPVAKDNGSGSPWYGITNGTTGANGATYPLAGYLDAFSGVRHDELAEGRVWSASARSFQAYVFRYTGTAAVAPPESFRANAHPVRCVKDTR
jgi:hypothetical protein